MPFGRISCTLQINIYEQTNKKTSMSFTHNKSCNNWYWPVSVVRSLQQLSVNISFVSKVIKVTSSILFILIDRFILNTAIIHIWSATFEKGLHWINDNHNHIQREKYQSSCLEILSLYQDSCNCRSYKISEWKCWQPNTFKGKKIFKTWKNRDCFFMIYLKSSHKCWYHQQIPYLGPVFELD